ncbi:hypothetical protein BVY02_01185 [bacterium J17]|nr:hypothetical protein BVY02_01185 [bacterium J17]
MSRHESNRNRRRKNGGARLSPTQRSAHLPLLTRQKELRDNELADDPLNRIIAAEKARAGRESTINILMIFSSVGALVVWLGFFVLFQQIINLNWGEGGQLMSRRVLDGSSIILAQKQHPAAGGLSASNSLKESGYMRGIVGEVGTKQVYYQAPPPQCLSHLVMPI